MLFRCLKGLRRLTTAALMVGLGTSLAYGDLLSNDDFETEVASSVMNIVETPFDLDVWGGESSIVVGSENGITPNLGTGMLRMFDDGLTFTQVVQRVDVTQFADLIDNDNACVDFSANFNAPDGQMAPIAGISLTFITALNGTETSLDDAMISQSVNTQSLDSNLATWESVSIEGTKVPVGTRSILVQLTFQNNTLNGLPGYADTTSMCIVECADCTFDVCQALCVCEDGQLTGDFSVNGLFTNLQSQTGAYLLVKPTAQPEGVEACFGNGHTSLVLDPPLMTGDSVTLGSYLDDSTAVLIKNAKSGDIVTFTLVLIADDGTECCSVDVEVELPPCDCWQIDKRHDEFTEIVCNDDGTVDFTYTYSLRSLFFYNGLKTPAYHSFLIALGDEYFEPDFFDIVEQLGTPLAFCDTATFTTRILGAIPGNKVDFIITLHAENVEECCIRPHMITAPVCDGCPMPPPSIVRGDMNEDGMVALDDIGLFVDMLTNSGFHIIADMNRDQVLDLADVDPFVEALTGQ